MGIFSSKNAQYAVGPELAALLPQDGIPWYRKRHLLRLNAILIIPWLSAAAYGFDGSMMNGLQSLTQWREYFDHPDASILGVMNAIYPIGKFFGLFLTAWANDRYGRKPPIIAGLILLVIGAAIQGAAQHVAMFIIGRLVLGFGTAFVAQAAPILVSELSYPTHRGKFTALYYNTYHLGAVIAAWSTYGTFRINSNWSWRIPSILQGAVPLLQLCLVLFVPESPRWLAAKGRTAEARRTLVKHHAGGDESSALVTFELKEIEESIRAERLINSETSYVDLIRTPANRKRTFIAVMVGWYATWSGVAVIAYYLTLVLDTIGITSASSQTLINALLQLFNFFSGITASTLVDRVGRRKLWLGATVGMLVCYVVWTALSARFQQTESVSVGRAVVAFIFLYYFCYDFSFIPLLISYPIEIFPYTLRARGLGASMATNQVALIVAQFVNPRGLTNIGWKYYIVFCVLLVVLLVIEYFFFPETNKRTLEEIAEIFEGPRPEGNVAAAAIDEVAMAKGRIAVEVEMEGQEETNTVRTK
ncbi:hypothetical protein AYO21_04499 [Fonsecaea monophora]|uniref:Major facilitator superfamily (MFS) profile domain-containing protein n=1 Tax=Fonsecaea monophora TaxID=254056 RepID=A0A177FBW6_9EURO|nr:hypothetical protein AYO21_04499 [Fonsecaea monophora]KAH0833758.1 Lactose permease [Fonsecaea pedrosoi]OAG41336.1 hypothetical protein AYO21_04499 [Fonsecaea monophora]